MGVRGDVRVVVRRGDVTLGARHVMRVGVRVASHPCIIFCRNTIQSISPSEPLTRCARCLWSSEVPQCVTLSLDVCCIEPLMTATEVMFVVH